MEKFDKDANQYTTDKTKIPRKIKASVRVEEAGQSLETYSVTSKSHFEISYLEIFRVIINTVEN